MGRRNPRHPVWLGGRMFSRDGGDVGKDSSTGPQNLGTVHENPVKVPRALAGFSAVCVSQGGTQKRHLQRLRSGMGGGMLT